jgi:GDP-4-dehydro-6-deoxy-D-mannose reductase
MRILVTGANGFVGSWLLPELLAAGHEAIGAPPSADLDITDGMAVARLIHDVRPDAVAHLAAVSYGPDARADPSRALTVNEGGTRVLMEAIRAGRPGVPVLVASSSEVYGAPDAEDLPLTETAPLRAVLPYGRSKLAQERIALELGVSNGTPVVVTRAFNHTGPGQRAVFVAPALAERALALRATGASSIRVGNVDVRRDFLDVRDVVRAYRGLLEGAATGSVRPGTVVNVASGRSVSIREILVEICRIAGVTATPVTDPSLVRTDDPAEMVGDASALHSLTGWSARIDLRTTLADLVASLEASDRVAGGTEPSTTDRPDGDHADRTPPV